MKKNEYRGARRLSREYAVKMLYGWADTTADVPTSLGNFWDNFRFANDVLGETLDDDQRGPLTDEVKQYASELVAGVEPELSRIDQLIRDNSKNWTLERMSKVDLSILRMTTYELLCRLDVPVNVAINEAVEIAKRFGTKDSPSFVNGILDKISKTCRTTDE